MTLQEHIYYIQNLINKGPRSDDSRYSDRLIAHALKTVRSRLINQKINKYDYVADANFGKLCINLSPYNLADECYGTPDDIKCNVLRSTCPLPKGIPTKWGSLLTVSTITNKSLDRMSPQTNQLSEYSLTNKSNTGWDIIDGFLIFWKNKNLKTVVVRDIWESPEELLTYCGTSTNCASITSIDFSIDPELVDPMYKLTLETLGFSFQTFPEDNLSNARSVEHLQREEPNENNI